MNISCSAVFLWNIFGCHGNDNNSKSAAGILTIFNRKACGNNRHHIHASNSKLHHEKKPKVKPEIFNLECQKKCQDQRCQGQKCQGQGVMKTTSGQGTKWY